MIWFEDLSVGDTVEFGSHQFTRDEIIEFARRYDPQPFHLSEEAAAKTPFGKIAASGWHTGSVVQRIIVDFWSDKGFMGVGSPGLDELRWLKPVFPGDTIRASSEIRELRKSRSRPELGTMHAEVSVYNQHDERVMRYDIIVMVLCDPERG